MTKDNKFKHNGGSWVSDLFRSEQVKRGAERKKSKIPEGYTKYSNLTTGMEILIDHEEYFTNIKKLTDIDLIIEDVVRVYESSNKDSHGAYELAMKIREVINE